MTAIDPFTHASPTYRNSERLGARNGSAFEITTHPKRSGLWLVAIGLAVVVAAGLFGGLA